MHESHWPWNLALVLSLCSCIPNLEEIEQFLDGQVVICVKSVHSHTQVILFIVIHVALIC